jgi:hypothetical protein
MPSMPFLSWKWYEHVHNNIHKAVLIPLLWFAWNYLQLFGHGVTDKRQLVGA